MVATLAEFVGPLVTSEGFFQTLSVEVVNAYVHYLRSTHAGGTSCERCYLLSQGSGVLGYALGTGDCQGVRVGRNDCHAHGDVAVLGVEQSGDILCEGGSSRGSQQFDCRTRSSCLVVESCAGIERSHGRGDVRESSGVNAEEHVGIGGPVPERVESGRSADVVGCAAQAGVRGPNYERNKANRDAAKRRKAERKRIGVDWRVRHRDKTVGDLGLSKPRSGFWNSCSDDVRQELIDSKARMHIARNEEEVRKCKAAKAKEESPETLLRNIYRIIELGEQKAKEVNNVKVSNWMGDVAVGCAETMASSAPSSLPSFKELSEKLAASSQSSFDLTLHAKDVEIFELQNELKARQDELKVQQLRHDSVVEDLNEVIDDLRLSETMAENRFSCLAKPKVKKSVEPKYFTAEQQKNHRQLTVRDMNGPFFH